jgi:hypothetical protein
MDLVLAVGPGGGGGGGTQGADRLKWVWAKDRTGREQRGLGRVGSKRQKEGTATVQVGKMGKQMKSFQVPVTKECG